MEASAPQPASNPSNGPETGTAEVSKPQTHADKVLYGGQELEIDKFFRQKKHKAKVDGKEIEVDYDELVNGYGHNKAANERMREAAEVRKRSEGREKALLDALNNWKTNPENAFKALEKLGIDVDDYAHKRVLDKMQYELMSEDERKSYDNERELNKYRAEEKRRREAEQKRQLAELEDQAVGEIENNIVDYLKKSGTQFTPELVGKAVDHIISALEEGQEIGVEEAFNRAQGWYKKTSSSIFQQELKALLDKGEVPKELAELVRKADIAQVRGQASKREPMQQRSEPKKAANMDDFFADLDRRYKR